MTEHTVRLLCQQDILTTAFKFDLDYLMLAVRDEQRILTMKNK